MHFYGLFEYFIGDLRSSSPVSIKCGGLMSAVQGHTSICSLSLLKFSWIDLTDTLLDAMMLSYLLLLLFFFFR